jgi:hypothetical protein
VGLGLEAFATLVAGIGPDTGVNKEVFFQVVLVTRKNVQTVKFRLIILV